MPWFKVDDGFYDHPKVLGLDMAAIGLWAVSGAYCARHLTDGVITDKQIRAIGGTRRQAEKLVAVGLWLADDAPPSERRYAFNDWRDFQPSRDETLRRREEDADRKRRAREAKADKQGKRGNVRPDNHPDVRPESALPGHFAPSALPDPTRPDPTHIEGKVVGETTGSRGANTETPQPEISDDVDSALDALAAAAADRPHIRGVCPRHPDGDTGDPCQGCAQAKRERDHDAQAEKRATRTKIKNCDWCDDRGLVEAHDHDGRPVALKCHHRDTPPAYEPPEPDPEPRFDPADFLNKLRANEKGTKHRPESTETNQQPEDDQTLTPLPKTGTGPF